MTEPKMEKDVQELIDKVNKVSKSKTESKPSKTDAIEAAIAAIEKQFGKGSIMKLGDKQISDIQSISTSCISLDAAIGIGGVPKGRIVEIYGPEMGGKSTLAMHIVAEAQKAGGLAAYIDAEHAMDANYAASLGVDIDNLFISQPDSGEAALSITEKLIESNNIDLIVIDSVAALVPQSELDGEMGQSSMGVQARLMSQALRKLTAKVSQSNTCLIFINQIREKIGVMFGNPETTTGGRALKFYSSLRLEVRKLTPIKDGDSIIGHRTKIKVVKNKLAPPFKEVELDLNYGTGFCKYGDLLDLATDLNIIQKQGAWYKYNGENIGQGRDNAKATISSPEWLNKIELQVRGAMGMAIPN